MTGDIDQPEQCPIVIELRDVEIISVLEPSREERE